MSPKQLFRAFFPITPGSGQMTLKALTAALLLALFGSTAWAFPTYDGCQECHGGFEANPYTSLHDSTNWGIDLMQGHWPFLDRNCNACHKSGGRNEVFLNMSSDATFSKGCVGCHGRDEDVTDNCTGLNDSQGGVEEQCGSGAGLRQYHELQVGAGTCSECHSGDATPVGEHIAPFNYGMMDIVMEDSCDGDGTESQFGATGLDNDGDGKRDGDDIDCQPNTPPTQPGELSVSGVTATSATVHWGASVDDDGDPISYQVDYRLNGETPWNDGGSTADNSQSLTDLEAGQPYDVQVTPSDGKVDGPIRSVLALFQTASADAFTINSGLNDAWFDFATNGQGFLITVFPNIKQMFLAWFTYDTERPPDDVTAMLGEPGHRWLTAQGPYDGDTATLTIFVTEGGVFDAPDPAAETDLAGDGTLTVEFADCTEGLVNYEITSLGISGTIPIQRLTADNVALCESLSE